MIMFNYPKFMALDSNGLPLQGGKVYTYKVGTTTLQTTYSDAGLTAANTNPVILDARGEALIYAASPRKLVLTTATGSPASPIWEVDNIGGQTQAVDIRDYGAVEGDVVDCTTAIQSAITDNEVVYIPAGTFKITAALDMVDGHVIYGDGPASIIHQNTAGVPGINNADDTVIRNLQLLGPGGAYDSSSIAINVTGYTAPPWTYPTVMPSTGGARSVMQDLTVNNWGSNGLTVMSGGQAINCTMTDCLNEGIIAEGYDILISGNRVSGCYSWGIDVSGSRIIVTDNILTDCGDGVALGSYDGGGIIANGGMWTTGSNDIQIRGNIISDCKLMGILVYAPSGADYDMKSVVVDSNTVRNVNTDMTGIPGAIALQDSTTTGGFLKNAIISNNIIDTTGLGHGIRAWDVSGGVTISGNHLKDIASNGISVEKILHDPANMTITSNYISGLVNYGIELSSLTKFNVSDNTVSGNTATAYGILCSLTTGRGTISNNRIDTCLVGLYSDATGDYLNFTDNDVSNGNTTPVSITGTISYTQVSNNFGFPLNPTLSGSPCLAQNTYGQPMRVTILGGTVSQISKGLSPGSLTDTNVTSGTVILQPGEYIQVTYSVAPTWYWVGV